MPRHFVNPWPEARDVTLDQIIDLVSRYNNEPNPAARAERLRGMLSQHAALDPVHPAVSFGLA